MIPREYQLFGTAECLRIGAALNERENAEFGPDFTWSIESSEHWLHSGCMFYSAVICPASHRIVGLTSVMLTGQTSAARLLLGEVKEQYLLPWFLESLTTNPILYFSSVLSEEGKFLPILYEKLLSDVESYLDVHQLTVTSGLTIALGPNGLQHLQANGFVPIADAAYLNKYEFMRIDATTAQTQFWRRLLRAAPATESHPPCHSAALTNTCTH